MPPPTGCKSKRLPSAVGAAAFAQAARCRASSNAEGAHKRSAREHAQKIASRARLHVIVLCLRVACVRVSGRMRVAV